MKQERISPLGHVPSGWRVARLKEIANKVNSGATPRGGESGYLKKRKHFALIRSQNVLDRRFDAAGLAFISDEQAAELAGAEVEVGDVLLNITGDGVTFARSALAPEHVLPACVNQHVMRIRPSPETCDPGFLLSYLTHPAIKDYIETFNAGGSRRAITKGHIESFEVPLPPLSEQHAIAQVLGTLDDKIELNRRMNETLEAMAQALFKSWFVDATQNGLPNAWSPGKLSDIADIIMGLSPAGESYNTDGIGTPLINGPVEFGDYFPVKSKWTTSPTRMAQAGDLIFCVRGSTTGRRVVSDGAYCLGRGVCSIRAKPHATTFLYQTISVYLDRLLSKTTGSVFPSLSAPEIKGFPIILPPSEVLMRFSGQADPLTEKIQANVRESRALAALRDALLPKLLSGEVRVSEAEKFVEAYA